MKHSFDTSELKEIISFYFPQDKVDNIVRLESGNINITFFVSFFNSKTKIILQHVNIDILNNIEALISNHIVLENHFDNIRINSHILRSFIPKLLVNQITNNKYSIYKKTYWRAYEYIEGSTNYDILKAPKQIYNLGKSLAYFHLSFKDISSASIISTIDNFHNTNFYLSQYDNALKGYFDDESLKLTDRSTLYCLCNIVSSNRQYYSNIFESLPSINISKGIIHADPKVSNFMFNNSSEEVLSIIDLDTISYNYFVYDIADCLRSVCNKLGEETNDFQRISLDIFSLRLFIQGYLHNSLDLLTLDDISILPDFLALITFELAVRFLTDFLIGDIYFKTSYKSHNLFRAKVQFKLLEDIKIKHDLIISAIKQSEK